MKWLLHAALALAIGVAVAVLLASLQGPVAVTGLKAILVCACAEAQEIA